MGKRYAKNNHIIYEKFTHTSRWNREGISSTAEIGKAIKSCPPEDIVKVCNRETRRHVELKCKELLDTIKRPKIQKSKVEKLKRELIDMLIIERLIYADEANETNRERSPVNIVRRSGLPSYFVNCIANNNPGWNYWFLESPIIRKKKPSKIIQ